MQLNQLTEAARGRALALVGRYCVPLVQSLDLFEIIRRILHLDVGIEGLFLRNGRHGQSGPAPGERAPILAGASPVGAGTTPRFALFAPHDPEGDALAARYRDLLEPDIRPPFSRDGIWLVRPDGYVALVAGHGHWAEVDTYLRRTAGG